MSGTWSPCESGMKCWQIPPLAALVADSGREIERPQEVHVHHHGHGVDAEDVAEILRRQLP